MAHQQTLVRDKRETLGSTKQKEGAMSAVVGIDVGAYKHAAAVCKERAPRLLPLDTDARHEAACHLNDPSSGHPEAARAVS